MKLESHLPRQSPWLYIAPLLNVILLLLVVFLLNSGLIVQSGITVEKPRSSSRLTGFERARTLTVTAGEQSSVYLDGARVTLQDLRQRLLEDRGGERRVIIHADRHAVQGRVVELVNLVQELGYEAALSTTPDAAPATP